MVIMVRNVFLQDLLGMFSRGSLVPYHNIGDVRSFAGMAFDSLFGLVISEMPFEFRLSNKKSRLLGLNWMILVGSG